jgi:hypothetical protein
MAYPAERQRDLAVSARAATIGREHIRLSYEYLNHRDTEGYASLVDPEARFHGPGPCVARGPQEAAGLLIGLLPETAVHTLHRIIVEDDGAAASGALTTADSTRHDFVDFFSISDHGLLLSWRRFLSA